MDRDRIQHLDVDKNTMLLLKDKDRLSNYIRDTLGEEHRSADTGSNSLTLLAFNKNQNVYTLIHANRKGHTLTGIVSNSTSQRMEQASYTNNNRCIHAHFDNVFFDGINNLTFKIEGTDYVKKIPDKTHFADKLGV